MSKRASFTWIKPMDADIDIVQNNFAKSATSNNVVSVMDKQQVRWIFNSAVCRKLNISWLWPGDASSRPHQCGGDGVMVLAGEV